MTRGESELQSERFVAANGANVNRPKKERREKGEEKEIRRARLWKEDFWDCGGKSRKRHAPDIMGRGNRAA